MCVCVCTWREFNMSHIETQCSHVLTGGVRIDASLSEHVIEIHLVFCPHVAPFSIFPPWPHLRCPSRCLQPGCSSPWGQRSLGPALKTTTVNMLIHHPRRPATLRSLLLTPWLVWTKTHSATITPFLLGCCCIWSSLHTAIMKQSYRTLS